MKNASERNDFLNAKNLSYLNLLADSIIDEKPDISDIIIPTSVESVNEFTLTDKQNVALKKAREWWLMDEDFTPPEIFDTFILEGCAGSGKTTIIRTLINEIGIEEDKVSYVTFTGKAASMMQRKGNKRASTIHRLIYNIVTKKKKKEDKIDPVTGLVTTSEESKDDEVVIDEIGFVLKNKEDLEDISLLVIDEYGMVDDKLMSDLETFGIRKILIGDPYQLPPPGKKNKYSVLKHKENEPNYTLLDEPMRQSLDSPILYLADRARKKLRIQYGEYDNCSVISGNDIDMEEFMKADQVIAGLNETVRKLNKTYRILSGIDVKNNPLPVKGEKLMCLKNNWGINISENGIDCNLINGLNVILESDITPENKVISCKASRVTVRPEFFENTGFKNIAMDDLFFEKDWNKIDELFNNRMEPDVKNVLKSRKTFEALNPTFKINPFTYGYVCTCYKYQGSEAPNIFFIQDHMPRNIYAQHLYTGITRASEKLTLVL